MKKVLFALVAFNIALLAIGSPKASIAAQDERLLLPITVRDWPGAYGSVWSTELWGFAERGKDVHYEPFFPACDPPCEDFNERNELYGIPEDNSYPAGILITKPGETPGGYLYVPSTSVQDVHFSLRLTERTGIAQTIQLPVVRASAFSEKAIRILGVPSQSFSRATVRVYGSDPDVPGLVRVRVYTEPDRRLLSEGTYGVVATQRIYATRNGQLLATKPPAAEIGNLTANSDAATVWIEIVPLTSGLRVWGFASVTDNRTQEVVLRTPDPSD